MIASKRFWLVEWGDESLQFSIQSVAMAFVTQMASKGIEVTISRHTEHGRQEYP